MMADDPPISIESFGASFKSFLEQMSSSAPADEPVFLRHLRNHFDADPVQYPILTEEFEVADHPNLQTAIEELISGSDCSVELIGVIGDQTYAYMGVTLSQLLVPARGGLMVGSGVTEGPVQYVNVSLEEGRALACVQSGLYLIRQSDQRFAILLRGPSEMGFQRKVRVEVMASDRARAENFLSKLRLSMRQHNVYRGRVLSLSADQFQGLQVTFHRLPDIRREQIILPEGLLDRIERQTVQFAKFTDKLLAAGRHLKRGILLHGPPGTGKTLTAMYLASHMRDRTVLLLTGRGLGLIEQSCAMARALQPAMIILEDVDLVAEERTRPDASCTVLLFELLNQMDGLADDADVIFLLTTNRPDILEPALAARPGRVDQAIEVPLPDKHCRRRLFDLYGQGLKLRLNDVESIVDRTEGASAAFIRELMRKAALFAADEKIDHIVIDDRHIDEALHELVIDGGKLTMTLLGMGSTDIRCSFCSKRITEATKVITAPGVAICSDCVKVCTESLAKS
jgi:cell division protease FtsH